MKKSSAQNVIPDEAKQSSGISSDKSGDSGIDPSNSSNRNDERGTCRIYYNGDLQDEQRKEEKLKWFGELKFETLRFENITPKKNNWINLADNDWEELVPLGSKGKEIQSIFNLMANSPKSNRDDWVYDYSANILAEKVKVFINGYNNQLKSGLSSENELDNTLKWSRDLRNKLLAKQSVKFDKSKIIKANWRPFVNKFFYPEKVLNDVLTDNHFQSFGADFDKKNRIIYFPDASTSKSFGILASTNVSDYHFISDTKYFPLYRYTSDGTREDNITDWGLEQFRERYENPSLGKVSKGRKGSKNPTPPGRGVIEKEDIFHYIYGVLHNPAYREKYALNLKREFPRLPFYEDFWQWAQWGKGLMELHIGYEEVEPYPLEKKDILVKGDSHKLKVKLKADKEKGIIQLDEQTSLHGVPAEAWKYKLGNRSALEWILDQYKEKKPKDKTIAEKFNTYRFADYKEQVIDLLKRVCTVSVETVKIVEDMISINN